MEEFSSSAYGTVHRAIYPLSAKATTYYEQTRSLVAKFIGASEKEEIIFTKGTTEGINLLAHCFSKAFLSPGDEVLICETEHHSNIVPWKIACEDRGAHIRVLPVNNAGEVEEQDLIKALSSGKVKLVGIAHIANATGTLHPIEKIIKLSHASGAKVLVDAAQSAPHLPLKVQQWDVDFLVFSGHKMYGPTGIGVLYGKKELLEALPPYQGGGDMVDKVSFDKITYQKPPLRFEAGTPNIVGVIGLKAAIEFLLSTGIEKIQRKEKELTSYAYKRLKELEPVEFLTKGEPSSSVITFTCRGCHSLDVGTLLGTRGISVRTGHLCAQPALARFGKTSAIRVSFGVYNTAEEIDRFIEALQAVLSLLH